MAALTIQEVVEAGLEATYAAAAAGGDTARNTEGNVVLHVKNGGAASITVTVTAQEMSREVDGFGSLSKSDAQVSIPAGEERFIGPFPRVAFNDAAGDVAIGYSDVTSVTIAALKVPTVS